mmetsp:Transcript_21948/g.45123  ORF Transcript_21948/g.45123 Transcript_21948/m.45123 type:complete len:450 (-) Transcript_21948:33-1382(-)
MKATLFDSHCCCCCFVKALAFALTIVALFDKGPTFSESNRYAAAFCSSHISICGKYHRRTTPNYYASAFCNRHPGRRNLWRTSSLSVDQGSSIHEWVSYLEEEFNKSDNNKEPKKRPFQTSVQTHTNTIDLLDQIDTAPPNDLTVVLFFAHYCKTCQRAFAPYKQLANNQNKGVHFCRLETSALTPKQFFSLGIDRLPFLQIYRNQICVASFSATQKVTSTSSRIVLKQRLLEHIDGCQLRSLTDWSAFRDRHDREIEANKAARVRIREAVGMQQTADNDDDDEDERVYRSVRTLTSESDLLYLLEANNGDENDEMVAIMFHSHFDHSCLRAQHKFRKIAIERQKNQLPCTMARIEASVLSERTLRSLGVEKYPHIQIYRKRSRQTPKECVASFSIPQSFLFSRMLHQSLKTIDMRTPEEWKAFYNQHQNEIESQQLALDGIKSDRKEN